jgi:hypothetical protein
MKWFDEWFYSKVRWAQYRGGIENPDWKHREDYLDSVIEDEDCEYSDMEVTQSSLQALGSDPHDFNDGIRIDVKRLNGGYVVTFRHPHDHRSHHVDDVKKNSYIIREDEDFNDRLGKLLTMELLK